MADQIRTECAGRVVKIDFKGRTIKVAGAVASIQSKGDLCGSFTCEFPAMKLPQGIWGADSVSHLQDGTRSRRFQAFSARPCRPTLAGR